MAAHKPKRLFQTRCSPEVVLFAGSEITATAARVKPSRTHGSQIASMFAVRCVGRPRCDASGAYCHWRDPVQFQTFDNTSFQLRP